MAAVARERAWAVRLAELQKLEEEKKKSMEQEQICVVVSYFLHIDYKTHISHSQQLPFPFKINTNQNCINELSHFASAIDMGFSIHPMGKELGSYGCQANGN